MTPQRRKISHSCPLAPGLLSPRRMASTLRQQRGFTLIELVFVVAIIAVLAAVAVTAYRKWISKAKTSEVPFMISMLQQRELSYQAENGSYLATATSETQTFPSMTAISDDNRAGEPNNIPASTWPVSWTRLRVSPGRDSLYCGYNILTGAAGTNPSTGNAFAAFGNVTPTKDWFYVHAFCNFSGKPTGTFSEYWVRDSRAFSTAVISNENQ